MLAEKVCAGTSGTRSAGPGPDDSTGLAIVGAVSRTHLSLLVPAETVAELLAHQRALEEATAPGDEVGGPRGAARVPCVPIDLPWSTVVPATSEDGTPVAMSELARALCDCEMTRIVMSAEGLPLDVGRTKRLFTVAQRRAVIARDGQCVWNGCEQHASRCEVHHIRWWDRDHGATSVTNAALLCKHHHSETHRLDLTIQRLEKPPGWVRRQGNRTFADPGGVITPGRAGVGGEPVELLGRTPMRYVFRNRREDIINAPSEDGSDH
jgi:hypothetical protein